MGEHFGEFMTFARHFFRYVAFVREVLIGLLGLLVLAGIAVSKLEGLELGDGVYFAFITGLSIGYGDITPTTGWGRVVSVFVGLVGMIFVGITVAIATRALADAVRERRNVK